MGVVLVLVLDSTAPERMGGTGELPGGLVTASFSMELMSGEDDRRADGKVGETVGISLGLVVLREGKVGESVGLPLGLLGRGRAFAAVLRSNPIVSTPFGGSVGKG